MGACIECGKSPKTELEESISSLLNSLLISKISNKEYVKTMKNAYSKSSIAYDLRPKFKEYLRPTDVNNRSFLEDLHEFPDKLNENELIFLTFALNFLTKSKNNFSVERNYYEMKEIFKRKIENYNDFELINLIVKTYGDFITTKLLKIYLNSRSIGTSKEDILYFQKCYSEENVNNYIDRFLGKMKKDFLTENFFVENLKYLQHDLFSENLKMFYQQNSLKDDNEIINKKINSNNTNTNDREINNKRDDYLVSNAITSKERKNLNNPYNIYPNDYNNEDYNHNFNEEKLTFDLNSNSNTPNFSNSYNNYEKKIDLNLDDPETNYARNTVSNILNKDFNINISSVIPMTTKLIKRSCNLKQKEDSSINEIREKTLKIHNEFRGKHSAKELIISEELQKFSQNWAEVLASNEKNTNSTLIWKGNIIGESIYQGNSKNFDINKILNSWYEKGRNYDYKINSSQLNTGEFTQMIWKNSKQIGIGFAESNGGIISIVVNYFPTGNSRSEFSENVSSK